MKKFQTTRIVRPSSVDFCGEILTGQVCRLLQEAAALHAEDLGVGLSMLQKNGQAWVITRLRLQLDLSVREGDTVVITTWPSGIDRVFFYRDFIISRDDGTPIGRATTAWVVMNLEARKLVQLTPEAVSKIEVDLPLWDAPLKKIKGAVQGVQNALTMAGFSDLDSNGHVNNARYVDWIMDSMPLDFLKINRVSRLDVNYLAEAQPGELINTVVAPSASGGFSHLLAGAESGVSLVRAETGWVPRGQYP